MMHFWIFGLDFRFFSLYIYQLFFSLFTLLDYFAKFKFLMICLFLLNTLYCICIPLCKFKFFIQKVINEMHKCVLLKLLQKEVDMFKYGKEIRPTSEIGLPTLPTLKSYKNATTPPPPLSEIQFCCNLIYKIKSTFYEEILIGK